MLRDRFYQKLSTFYVMLVGGSAAAANRHRFILKSIGFANVLYIPSHRAALNDESTIGVTHVLFEIRNTDVPVASFMERMRARDKKVVLVPIIDSPKIEEVFGLLRDGARGALIPPLTINMVEEVLVMATTRMPVEKLLNGATDRNRLFSEIILNNLFHLALAYRCAREAPQFEGVIYRWTAALYDSVQLGLTYAENGPEALRDRIVEGCIERAENQATRLTKLRKALGRQRAGENPVIASPYSG